MRMAAVPANSSLGGIRQVRPRLLVQQVGWFLVRSRRSVCLSHATTTADSQPRTSQERAPGFQPSSASVCDSSKPIDGSDQVAHALKLESKEVLKQPTCQAVAELLVSQPDASFSYSAFDAALNQAIVLGDLTNAADCAAAERLAAYSWDRIDQLQRWPLVRLFKMAVHFGRATPARVAAWRDRLLASGGVQQLTPNQAADLLEAARVLTTKKGGRAAAAELSPRLLSDIKDWMFDYTRHHRSESSSDEDAAGGSSNGSRGGASVGSKGNTGSSSVFSGGLAAADSLPGTGSSRGPLGAAERSAGAQGGGSRSIRQQEEGGAGVSPEQPMVPIGVDDMSLRKLSMLYSALHAVGVQLSGQQARRMAVAVARRVQQGEFDAGRVVKVLQAWAAMQSAYMYNKSSQDTARRTLPGYPGDWVMRVVVGGVHANRDSITPQALAQVLAVLGSLNYAPHAQVLADLVAALEPRLASRHGLQEVAAVLPTLAKLGVDPGAEFASNCYERVRADGGKDQGLLASTAWSLAVLRRCTPQQWQVLLSLQARGDGQLVGRGRRGGRNSSGATSTKVGSPGHQLYLRQWLTAYLLLREQYKAVHSTAQQQQQQGSSSRIVSSSLPTRSSLDSEVAAQPTTFSSSSSEGSGQNQGEESSSSGAAGEGGGYPGEAAPQGAGGGSINSSGGGGSSEAGGEDLVVIEPLPATLLEAALEAARSACSAKAARSVGGAGHDLAEVLWELSQGRVQVQERYCLKDPVTGAPLLADVAIPRLRLAFHVSRASEFSRNTGAPSATVLVRNRLVRLAGWELIALPAPPLLRQIALRYERRRAGQRQQGVGVGLGWRSMDETDDGWAVQDVDGRGEEGGARRKKWGMVLEEGEREGEAMRDVDLRPVMRSILLCQPGLLQKILLQPEESRAESGRERGGRRGPRQRQARGRDSDRFDRIY